MTARTATWLDRSLWCAALVVALLVAWQGIAYAASRGDVAQLTDRIAQVRGDAKAPGTDKTAPSGDDPLAKAITERNVFAPPKPTGFQGKLTAVFGDTAVFNDSQTGKVGDTVMGAKILTVGANWVEVEFEGKTIKQQVFDLNGMPPDMKAALEKDK